MTSLDREELGLAVAEFCLADNNCPPHVVEEYCESQFDDVEEGEDDEEEKVEDEPLLIEPVPAAETHNQDDWMQFLRPIQVKEQEYDETDNDYDDVEFLQDAATRDWSEDARTLKLSHEDIEQLPKWLDLQKQSFAVS